MDLEDKNRNALQIKYILHKKYKIISILGSGNFGITYKCIDSSTDSIIAIKEYLPSEFAVREDSNVFEKSINDKKIVQKGLSSFRNEAKILTKFRGHPNIVEIYDLFEENNTAYFVMPYENAKTLEDVMSEKNFTQNELISLIISILEALKKVHSMGILHRDLKPANILMRGNKIPVLIDFGAAKNLLSSHSSLLDALTKGYAAPEQYSTRLKQGPYTDIYALGIIMYRFVTNFKDNKIPTSNERVHGIELEWPQESISKYSNELIRIIKKASFIKAEDRYQDAQSMQDDLFHIPEVDEEEEDKERERKKEELIKKRVDEEKRKRQEEEVKKKKKQRDKNLKISIGIGIATITFLILYFTFGNRKTIIVPNPDINTSDENTSKEIKINLFDDEKNGEKNLTKNKNKKAEENIDLFKQKG